MASKTARTATIGCVIAGLCTFFVGIPFSFLGSIARVFYGPDSIHAEFETDVSSLLCLFLDRFYFFLLWTTAYTSLPHFS